MLKIINQISLEFFYILTISLIIFTILELIWPGIVLGYFNINLLLILWLLNASVLLITTKNKNYESNT